VHLEIHSLSVSHLICAIETLF